MKTLIVATDFSATATNAVWYATDVALAINADLLLFHIVPISGRLVKPFKSTK